MIIIIARVIIIWSIDKEWDEDLELNSFNIKLVMVIENDSANILMRGCLR